MAAVMIGNGVSGIFSNFLRIIFLLILPGDKNMFKSALIFFGLSALFLLFCSFLFKVLITNKFYLHYKPEERRNDDNFI